MNQTLSSGMHEITPANTDSGKQFSSAGSQKNYLEFAGKRIFIALAVFIFFLSQTFADQPIRNSDTSETIHSPRRASIYSALVPGLGQVYNKKYWKAPIIYGGFGAIYYVTSSNTQEYRKFLQAYRYIVNRDTVPINNEYVGRYNEQQLLSGKNYFRRNVEIGYIIGGVLYILNIIDASVDAHLFNYDVSENLSLKLEPAVLNDPMASKPISGFSLTLKF